MDITFFGFKMNLEILILIGVVYLILAAHTIGGCCNMPLIMEGVKNMNLSNNNNSNSNSNSNSNLDASGNIIKVAALKKRRKVLQELT